METFVNNYSTDSICIFIILFTKVSIQILPTYWIYDTYEFENQHETDLLAIIKKHWPPFPYLNYFLLFWIEYFTKHNLLDTGKVTNIYGRIFITSLSEMISA